MAFEARSGVVTGGIKPVLQHVVVSPAGGGLWSWLRAKTMGVLLATFSDRVPGRKAVVTVIPIHGTLSKPGVQLWPALAGIVHNAFVAGIRASFAGGPPPPGGAW
jgi:hypothetical protein